MRKAVIIGIVFLSGFCALVCQITWERILRYIWGGRHLDDDCDLGFPPGAGRLHRKPVAVYGLIQIALGDSLIGIFVPLGVWQWRTRKEAAVRQGGTVWYTLCFAGFGYILVELNLIQKFSIFLGHPIYALAIILAGLLILSGYGYNAVTITDASKNGLGIELCYSL